MKNYKLKSLLAIALVCTYANTTDYDNTVFDNHVSGQGVNEVLAEAQTIICALSRMGTEDLAGDGTYKATIYMNECEQAAAQATDSTQGTTKPTSASGSSSSSASSTSTANTNVEVDTVIVNSGFYTADMQTTKGWLVNEKPWNERTNREPKNILYLLNEQTAPVSDSSKFGTFTLRYQLATYGNKQSDLPEWYQCPSPSSNEYKDSWCSDGNDLGRAILIADGGNIKFKSDQVGSEQQNVVAEYFDNGNIAGIYTRSSGFMDESLRDDSCDEVAYQDDGSYDGDAWWNCQPEAFRNSNVSILGIFSFGIEASTKTYCTKMSELYEVDWNVWDEETQQAKLIPYALTDTARAYLGNSNNWDTEEKCFSIDKDDAIRNIWDYGVFNKDGSSYSLDNQSFPIRTNVEVNNVTRRVHGYASYWGTHFDEEYEPYVDESTEWVRDDWSNSNSGDTEQEKYTLKVKGIEIDKREKSYISLNELDATSFRFWVNDEWWSDEFQKLGFPKVNPWDGKVQFKTNKATLTDYNNGNSNDPLTYGLYGYKPANTNVFVADLIGATLDKDNIRKIIKNDSNDPGKPINVTLEFQEFPKVNNGLDELWQTERTANLFLCNKSIDIPTRSYIYQMDHLGLTNGACIHINGVYKMSSDGTEVTLSNDNRYGVYVNFYDYSSQTNIGLNTNDLNNGGDGTGSTVGLVVKLDGVQRPTSLELRIQDLLSRFGSISQGDANGGDIQKGLESFLDSSSTFSFLISAGMSIYDHEGNRFENIMGRFNVSDSPSPSIFVDDVKITELTGSNSDHAFVVSLSKAQASDVTVDYVISNASTASSNDYENLSNGTLTIAAGSTSSLISFSVIGDGIAEGQDDEKIILTLSNPVNAVLGRSNATAFIYDDDTNRVVYDDYYGTFDAETSTFTVSEGLIYNPNYRRENLPAPITFTTSDWVEHMSKTWDEGTEYENTFWRELGLYSDDTNQDYNISKEAMLNPTSATKEAGVSTTKWSRISPDDLPSRLNCIEFCPVASKVLAHYTDAKNQVDPSGDNTYVGSITSSSPSPHSDVGPYIKQSQTVTITYDEGEEWEWSEDREYTKGEYMDGIVASEVYKYTKSNSKLLDAESSEIKIDIDWGTSRPGELIRGVNYLSPNGQWQNQTEWGIWSGMLIQDSDMQYIECDHRIGDNDEKIYDFHPDYTTANGKLSETRYCINKMWGNDDILVTYNINIRLEKQYDIYKAADGLKLELSPPKTLYFTTPNDSTKFGNDAGKKFRLDYQGDHLGGIPGNVINIDTGEVLGEYVEEWKDEYRWVQRFVIPDGTILKDSSDNEFLVKAIRGEEWLGKKDSSIGTLSSLLSAKSKSDLLTNVDVDWEISQRREVRYDCSLTRTFTNTFTYTDENGETQTGTDEYTGTDWDACHALEYNTDEYWEVWSVTAEFANCNERLQYDYDEVAARIEEEKQRAEDEGRDYDWRSYPGGPIIQTPYDDAGWMGDAYSYIDDDGNEVNQEANRWGHRGQMDRCKAIGTLPTSFINNGNATVVNGTVVYDPSP